MKTIVLNSAQRTDSRFIQLNRPHMLEIVRQCVRYIQQGYRIIIVTSGAVAAGRYYLNNPQLPATIASKQCGCRWSSQLIQTIGTTVSNL